MIKSFFPSTNHEYMEYTPTYPQERWKHADRLVSCPTPALTSQCTLSLRSHFAACHMRQIRSHPVQRATLLAMYSCFHIQICNTTLIVPSMVSCAADMLTQKTFQEVSLCYSILRLLRLPLCSWGCPSPSSFESSGLFSDTVPLSAELKT